MVNTRSGERVNITKKIGKVALKNQFIDSACDRLFDALTDELIDNFLETETLNNIFIDSACDSLFDTLASELIDNSLEVLALVEPRKKFPNLKKFILYDDKLQESIDANWQLMPKINSSKI